MVLLVNKNKFVIIAANRSLIVYNTESNTHNKVDLPDPISTVKPKQDSDNETVNSIPNKTECTNIQGIRLSNDKNMLAIFTKSKEVMLFNWKYEDTVELNFLKIVSRVPSAVCFSPDSSILLVADKTGDCLKFDCHDEGFQPSWILGHLSMVLDVLFSEDGKFIITSDRDEKIRVTKYPETHVIESYCLGHAEYVSSIKLVPHSTGILMSISGDSKIKLWNFIDGVELNELKLSSPGYELNIHKQNDESSILVVTLYELDEILIYKVTDTFTFLQNHKFTNQFISSVTFVSSYETILLSLVDDDGEVLILKLLFNDNYKQQINLNEFNSIVKKYFKNIQLTITNELSLMFKKKFDNIKDYQDRKRKRIEGKD